MTKTLIETGETLLFAKLIGIEYDEKAFYGIIHRDVITLRFYTNLGGKKTYFETENFPSYNEENDAFGIEGTDITDFFSSGLLGELVLLDTRYEECWGEQRLTLTKLIPYNRKEVIDYAD